MPGRKLGPWSEFPFLYRFTVLLNSGGSNSPWSEFWSEFPHFMGVGVVPAPSTFVLALREKASAEIRGEFFRTNSRVNFAADFLVDFFGPFSLEGGGGGKIHPKIHGNFQIRIWEFRGQNPHCKDPALIFCPTTGVYFFYRKSTSNEKWEKKADLCFARSFLVLTSRGPFAPHVTWPQLGLFFVPACPPWH